MSENGEIYTAGQSFTLSPAVTAVTNLTSDDPMQNYAQHVDILCFTTLNLAKVL